MTSVNICISTRNRINGLKMLLDSIFKMQQPADARLRVVVVENDKKEFSRNVVNEFKLKTRIIVDYFLEPNIGLVFARNRSVKEAGDCDFCCFVDDDQVVDPSWMVELLKCQKEYDADGVWGSNPPIFGIEVPKYIRKFHTPKKFEYGEIVNTGFTNCLMVKKSFLDKIEGPFDARLNFSGGEDTFLIFKIIELGGVIRSNQNARAYEIIPDERTTIKFVIRRTIRISNTGIFVRSLKNPSFRKINALPRLVMRFCYGILIVIPFFVFSTEDKLKGLIKIVNAVGGFKAICGHKDDFYKKRN